MAIPKSVELKDFNLNKEVSWLIPSEEISVLSVEQEKNDSVNTHISMGNVIFFHNYCNFLIKWYSKILK
ncbi:hypothetical protein GCM10007424_11760 [Flavobacterium suaedae]|uniref:Uncharacterized protein n=1 Tax=Flavobacterium suaedae TaxID=1767027 RepID=A0ABQ1JPF5_9FLAO|nr:hypothetical protein GCM10007424_11760 [Flavobacterium suaedae]